MASQSSDCTFEEAFGFQPKLKLRNNSDEKIRNWPRLFLLAQILINTDSNCNPYECDSSAALYTNMFELC